METKVCSKCGRELPISEFHKRSSSPDGLQYHCKECVNAANKQYYKRRTAVTIGGGKQTPISDPDFDGKDPGEVVRMMGRAQRWLQSRGFTIRLDGEYAETKVHKLKF